MVEHSNAHHLNYVDRHCHNEMTLTLLKSGLWNEGSPWKYTAKHIMYVMLTDSHNEFDTVRVRSLE